MTNNPGIDLAFGLPEPRPSNLEDHRDLGDDKCQIVYTNPPLHTPHYVGVGQFWTLGLLASDICQYYYHGKPWNHRLPKRAKASYGRVIMLWCWT